ncbi:hypothetical protein [Kitasatospora kifunensis]|uniref:Histidine phosphatase family protein n=1 Tax=Kitasatospora kifunensis TaxID=58351 RepID=A0A7W7R8G2_KITKI|nr:hypothetical protein [Kitasatospora kifunensis]MBB4927214.1 hypothetical protein [Kitasatospora kifunensis]
MVEDKTPARRALLGAFAAAVAVPALGGCGTATKKKDAKHQSAAAAKAVAAADTAPAAAPAAGSVIMIIRHAEKPTGSGAPYGVTDQGVKDSESLTIRGWTRAGALVSLFAPRTAGGAAAPVPAGLTRPTKVYAADPNKGGSKRPAETASAVAAALGLTLDEQYAKGQEAELATALLATAGPQLVAWEHESIAAIIAKLGSITPTPPASWPDARFDVVWVLTANGGGWNFSQVPQLLLAGDSPDPIS